MASMDGEAVMIHEDECADVALPAEVYVHMYDLSTGADQQG